MLASGDVELFRPLLRWYLSLLPLALERTQLWYGKTHPGIEGMGHENRTRFYHLFYPLITPLVGTIDRTGFEGCVLLTKRSEVHHAHWDINAFNMGIMSCTYG